MMATVLAQKERSKQIDGVIDEIVRERTQGKIAFRLEHRSGLKGEKHTMLLCKLAAGCSVLLY